VPKNIVICCDGTGNEFGQRNSNVIKLYRTLIRSDQQLTYYHPGLGTMGARSALTPIGKWWTRVIGLAFGYGISDNVADAYQFLMRRFEPDDRIYVFGFSRGAYTARALCGMLHIVGLLTEDNEALIPYAIRMLKARNIDFKLAAQFKSVFSRPCKPHFLGAWDTVSSVGWVYSAVHFPFTGVSKNPDLRIARHAVSIDERRAFFRQHLLGAPHDPEQDVKEVWFAGVHSDVGGSYPEPESQLSQISLRWMLGEAETAGLGIDPDRKAAVLGSKAPFVAPDPLTENQHESLIGAWWIAEVWPKFAMVKDGDDWKRSIYFNFGRRRYIADGITVHESVERRLAATNLHYQPKNLPAVRSVIGDVCETRESTA
jgi:uncharacterized protein (DUF2235 family)